jgi:RNA polymerase sporulation-specific sigma factor
MMMIQERLSKNLSRLEADVLRLFTEGHSYAQMAKLLDKKEKSIDNALHRIKTKLQVILEDIENE